MRKMLNGVIIALVAAAGGALLAAWSAPLAGQTPAAYRAPRTADGKPDLNGIWQSLSGANYDLEAHMARPAMALRPGPYGPVPAAAVLALGAVGAVPPGMGVVEGGPIPYKPEALAKKKENQEKWLERDPEIKCYLPGVPRATYMPYPFQILQSQSAMFFAYEYAGAVRNIYLKDPGPPPVDAWMGQSVGRWEGDTFVIESNGFNDSTWFDRAGNHHTRGAEGRRALSRAPRPTSSRTKRRWKIRTSSRGPGRSACRSTAGSRRTCRSWISSASSSSKS